ncbi:hypothetical protein X975_04118, partial [Stegodyphus mimosarum]
MLFQLLPTHKFQLQDILKLHNRIGQLQRPQILLFKIGNVWPRCGLRKIKTT